MKKIPFLILASLIVFYSCKKGDPGPEGQAGVAGPAGPTGNANVRLYSFGTRTITTGTLDDTLTNLTKGFVDSSLVLAYFEVSSVWYPVPGPGVAAAYNTRYLLFQNNPNPSSYIMRFSLTQPNSTAAYTTSVTWDRVKIIIAPASVITLFGKNAGGTAEPAPDVANYYDVCRYYHLQP